MQTLRGGDTPKITYLDTLSQEFWSLVENQEHNHGKNGKNIQTPLEMEKN